LEIFLKLDFMIIEKRISLAILASKVISKKACPKESRPLLTYEKHQYHGYNYSRFKGPAWLGGYQGDPGECPLVP